MQQNQKVAVVTGGGSGIGRASAVALAKAGFAVAVAGRRVDALRATVEEAGGDNAALAVPTDVADPASIAELFGTVRDTFGRIDVLLNNAGQHGPDAPLEEVTLAEWQGLLASNLTSVFLCTQEAVRTMKTQRPRGGRIINNASVSAHSPLPNGVAYTATKHAITALTKQTLLEGRDVDITCSQLDIGSCLTDMMISMEIGGPSFDVQHVADAVVYLASLPLNATVQSMLMYATGMPFVGRG